MPIAHYDRFEIGKDIPGMGPFRNYKPKLVGPAGSKIKAGIYIGYQVGKFIMSRPWAKGTLTGTAIGTGLGLIGEAPSDNQHIKTLRSGGKRSNSRSRHKKYGAHSKRRSNCHCQCTRCC